MSSSDLLKEDTTPAPAQNSPVAEATQETSSATPADATKAIESGESFNATVRVRRDSSTRNMISFVMSRLERGGTITLQALSICVKKAVTIASIARNRVGNVHQVNSLLVVQESSDEGTSKTASGIQIVLSTDPLSSSEVGYQKPKPQGYASYVRRRPRVPDNRRDQFDDAKSYVSERKPAQSGRKAKVEKSTSTDKPAEPSTREKSKARASSRRPEQKQASSTRKESPKRQQSEAPVREKSTARRRRAPPKQEQEKAEVAPRTPARSSSRRGAAPPSDNRAQQPRRDSPPEYGYGGRPQFQGRPPYRPDFHHHNGGRPYGQRRGGAPYEVGQSHRYMPGFRESGDPYFQQYDMSGPHQRRGAPQGMRGGGGGHRDMARPGYFPAARYPVHPDQMKDDFPPQSSMRGGRYGALNRTHY